MLDKDIPSPEDPDFWDSIPPPEPPEDWGWADQSLAEKEERNWGELDKALEKNDINWAKAYGIIIIVFAVTFSLIFLGSLVVWSLHYLLPERCLWLSAEQLSKTQSVLFSGGMGAVISSMLKKQIDRLHQSKQ